MHNKIQILYFFGILVNYEKISELFGSNDNLNPFLTINGVKKEEAQRNQLPFPSE